MARRGDGIYQRGGKGGTWYLDFVFEGKRHVVRLGRGISRTVAREIAGVKRGEILKGEAGIGGEKKTAAAIITLGQAVERYVQAKARKRTIGRDAWYLAAFSAAFGAATPLTEITAARISAWKAERLGATSAKTKELYSAAAINRPLQALSGLLHLAHEEWEVLPSVPRIRLEKEPEGHVRWLEPDEETRLIDACRAIRTTPDLANIATMALETGMRKGELGLTWDRIDLSRGVIRLELTKSGKRREIPMRQVVYDTLAGRLEPREGRVWPGPPYIDHAFTRATTAAALDEPFRFHDCRHHFASWFMMRGGSLPALMEILGHATIKMTMRYAHLSPGHLRAEMAKTERPAGVVSTPTAIHNAEDVAESSLR